ncbi:MAG: type II toxin-antitoxin system VapC family toxin [Xanthomonadales bacterium]|nr:type II toxin-antitoxin system VapC family toxin [Xanthomonadales bacterium]MBK7145195.1 type II toxin-antitoxin system VapC family toxin [Xanthomonadales bacterium]MCC6559723.1 type II toxin-antitoxin system VapC family toxin [Xanthomonadales bacterium]
MTGFVLDTNVWIALLKSNPEVVAGVRRVGIESLYLCAPVWSELWFGACNSQRVTENQGRIRELASHVPSLPFDDRAAEHCGEIRALLARQGRPIGPYDLQIAAIARSAGLRLVTRNISEYSRVPGLTIENWQTDS